MLGSYRLREETLGKEENWAMGALIQIGEWILHGIWFIIAALLLFVPAYLISIPLNMFLLLAPYHFWKLFIPPDENERFPSSRKVSEVTSHDIFQRQVPRAVIVGAWWTLLIVSIILEARGSIRFWM